MGLLGPRWERSLNNKKGDAANIPPNKRSFEVESTAKNYTGENVDLQELALFLNMDEEWLAETLIRLDISPDDLLEAVLGCDRCRAEYEKEFSR